MSEQSDDSDREVRLGPLDRIAQQGAKIYEEKYKTEYEERYPGQYVAIDLSTGEAYVGVRSADALQKAREEAPQGIFHLIQVGATAAFKTTRRVANAWL